MLRVENSQNPCRHWVVAGLLPRKINVAGPDPKKTQCLQPCCGCCGSSRGKCVVAGYRPRPRYFGISSSRLHRSEPIKPDQTNSNQKIRWNGSETPEAGR